MVHKDRICYFYYDGVGDFHYGVRHPMKPHRLAACHNLIVNYGLCDYMKVIKPAKATALDMMRFHSPGKRALRPLSQQFNLSRIEPHYFRLHKLSSKSHPVKCRTIREIFQPFQHRRRLSRV